MSLARASATNITSGSWGTVCTVSGDGAKQVIGAIVTCDDPAIPYEARIQINSADHVVGGRALAGTQVTLVDAPTTIPNGQSCTLQVKHAAGSDKTFTGTLLGG